MGNSSLDHLVMPDEAIVFDHESLNSRRHDGDLRVPTRELMNRFERRPMGDDHELDS